MCRYNERNQNANGEMPCACDVHGIQCYIVGNKPFVVCIHARAAAVRYL